MHRCLADLHGIFCAARASDALLMSPSSSNDKRLRQTGGLGAEEPPPWRCESLIRTNLFAAATVTPAANADVVAPLVRGGLRKTPRGGSDNGGGGGSDLSQLSRWALAVRAPTLAEFISADMLLVPAKLWKWFAKDDIMGRR